MTKIRHLSMRDYGVIHVGIVDVKEAITNP
jgi:hypothetical protein